MAASARQRRTRIGVISTLVALAVWLVTAASASAFSANGSAEQVYVTGLAPSAEASLKNKEGATVYTQNADAQGGLLFRKVSPGTGYKVRLTSTGEESGPVTVHSTAAAPWNPSVYNQEIPEEGYTYLTTRDGTQLAINVHPPTHPAGEPGTGGFEFGKFPIEGLPTPTFTPPYPTLIEYSGYGYANPAGPESGIAVLANLMGFAVVDVNMRGTGCSGGAYDFFEAMQNLDGYDVIETIAKQPWVLHNKVGMLGISYGGISQMFTAQLQPPSLAAIAPLSVIDATATTLYPGGIVNDGFAVAWAEERQQNAEPAGPGKGQKWAYERVQEGDETCAANQALHGEAANLLQKINENSTYNAAVADPLDPVTFVHNIKVPTFLVCQFEDEQTGGHCPTLVQHFTGAEKKWFTFTNGAHIDSLDPATYNRLYDFYMLYVAQRPPIENQALVRAAAPVVYKEAMGLPEEDVVTLPADKVQTQPTYELALKEFEEIPEVRVLFDNGAGESPNGDKTAGNPYAAYEQTFTALPVPGTVAQSWYFGPKGALTDAPPTAKGVNSFTSDANSLPFTDYTGGTGGGGLWGNASQWSWNWQQYPAGSAVSYVSAPLTEDTTAVGAGAVKLWVKSSTSDVDLLATVSEVRPDGNETFVQNGWMRASLRKLAGRNAKNLFKQIPTELEPIPSLLASNVRPMPKGFAKIVIPLYFEGHAYRAGSRIRITIAGPNGTQPIWSSHHTQPAGTTSNDQVVFAPRKPSKLTLPVVPGLSVPTELPPCPSLRNEPCRPYQEYVNNGA